MSESRLIILCPIKNVNTLKIFTMTSHHYLELILHLIILQINQSSMGSWDVCIIIYHQVGQHKNIYYRLIAMHISLINLNFKPSRNYSFFLQFILNKQLRQLQLYATYHGSYSTKATIFMMLLNA